eukprot:GEZU01019403.1.p1 GENE.GEZU01019403.1~~GEZU01019403.1.p1  ORF type:complete len:420 (-),score=111.43 GEZU01019403.1:159-1418(-)
MHILQNTRTHTIALRRSQIPQFLVSLSLSSIYYLSIYLFSTMRNFIFHNTFYYDYSQFSGSGSGLMHSDLDDDYHTHSSSQAFGHPEVHPPTAQNHTTTTVLPPASSLDSSSPTSFNYNNYNHHHTTTTMLPSMSAILAQTQTQTKQVAHPQQPIKKETIPPRFQSYAVNLNIKKRRRAADPVSIANICNAMDGEDGDDERSPPPTPMLVAAGAPMKESGDAMVLDPDAEMSAAATGLLLFNSPPNKTFFVNYEPQLKRPRVRSQILTAAGGFSDGDSDEIDSDSSCGEDACCFHINNKSYNGNHTATASSRNNNQQDQQNCPHRQRRQRWTAEEKRLFFEGMEKFNANAHLIAKHIGPSRTLRQVQKKVSYELIKRAKRQQQQQQTVGDLPQQQQQQNANMVPPPSRPTMLFVDDMSE